MKKSCLPAVLSCLLALVPMKVFSKGADSLYVRLSTDISVGSSSTIRPLWSYSQDWGHHTTSSRVGVASILKTDWRFLKTDFSELHIGAAVEASKDDECKGAHELYLKGRVWKFDFSLGMDEYTPIDQQSGLGTGSYLMTDNAKPVPKVAAGLYRWTSLPFISDYIQVKGGASFGYIPNKFYETDPNCASYTKNVLQHEKFMYIRAGHWPVKPYAGLVHSVLMGGTLPDGTKIPVDFIASFFAKGSSSLADAGYGGEQTNAAGAHQGMWELGTDINTSRIDAGLYYRRPFADSRAIGLFNFGKCKDFTIGMDLKVKDFSPLKEVCIEYMTTLWQGGRGLPDACFKTESGESVTLTWKEMTPEKIHTYFSEDLISNWEASHGTLSDFSSCKAFLEHYTNNDEEFGGRTDYLCNYLYPQGWSVGSLSSGSPMFLTDVLMSKFAPEGGFTNRFPNVRMRTVCVGAKGSIIPRLDYRFKVSFVSNQGSYREEYEYWSWTKNENYYFKQPLKEVNTGLWLIYDLGGMDILASAFCDFGEMYKSSAFRLGVTYSF